MWLQGSHTVMSVRYPFPRSVAEPEYLAPEQTTFQHFPSLYQPRAEDDTVFHPEPNNATIDRYIGYILLNTHCFVIQT